jgi:hypothetical protein
LACDFWIGPLHVWPRFSTLATVFRVFGWLLLPIVAATIYERLQRRRAN